MISQHPNIVPSSYRVHQVTSQGLPPYFDFISISRKVKGFDTTALTRKNDCKYQLKKEFTPVDIFYSQQYHTLTVKGSLPWFKNGHNLSFDQLEFQTAINDLSITLDVDMTGAGVKSFELSKIIPVDIPVKEIQDNHLSLTGFERIHKQNTLYWNWYTRRGKGKNEDLVLKMYNATANAISKGMSVIPDMELLKFEMKLNNPSKHFGYAVTVDQLYNSEIINKTYNQMKHYYDQIEKSKAVTLPDKPTSEDLILAGLINSSKEPMREIEILINSADGLSKQARYKRRQLIRTKIESLTVEDSKYLLPL